MFSADVFNVLGNPSPDIWSSSSGVHTADFNLLLVKGGQNYKELLLALFTSKVFFSYLPWKKTSNATVLMIFNEIKFARWKCLILALDWCLRNNRCYVCLYGMHLKMKTQCSHLAAQVANHLKLDFTANPTYPLQAVAFVTFPKIVLGYDDNENLFFWKLCCLADWWNYRRVWGFCRFQNAKWN